MPPITVQNQCGCKSGKNNLIKGPAELVFKPCSDLSRESFVMKFVESMEDLKREASSEGCG